MNGVSCMIIEDEFPPMELLKGYLSNLRNWTVKAEFNNALDAIAYLSTHSVDVIFLDIQLPKLSGINFIKTLENPPIIVITSAYNEHAVEAFELIVFDYLLKPYSFERFMKTIHRINRQISSNLSIVSPPEVPALPYILIKENRETLRIECRSIQYIESQKEYVKVVCPDRTLKTKLSIAKVEEMLAEHNFIRVHRSYLVPLIHVQSYTAKHITLKHVEIPIGRYYQKEALKRLTAYFE